MRHGLEDLIAEHTGDGVNRDVETRLYRSNEYTYIHIEDNMNVTQINFRNIGDLNEQSSIQFVCEQYRKHSNRTKHMTFSIPLPLVEMFIKRLSTIKKPNT